MIKTSIAELFSNRSPTCYAKYMKSSDKAGKILLATNRKSSTQSKGIYISKVNGFC